MSTATLTYQCPNCSAGLKFDAEKQKFCCEFCLSEFDKSELENTEAEERAKAAEAESAAFCAHMVEYSCPSCGAQVTAEESTAATFCYWCHNPVVLTGRLSGQLRPHKVIPFKIDRDKAKEIFYAFVRKHKFLPRDYFSEEQAAHLSGVYFPFWATDADTDSIVDGKAERVRRWRSGNVETTEISDFRIHRRGDIHFEDIVTSAISTEDKEMLEGILPYPSDSLVDFEIPYLQGFTAKKRDLEQLDVQDQVSARMRTYAKEVMRRTVTGYTSTQLDECQVKVKKSHWDYTLMPIWVLTYKGRREKPYVFSINGYTGKVWGEVPVSRAKLLALFGGLLAGVAGLIALIGWWLF